MRHFSRWAGGVVATFAILLVGAHSARAISSAVNLSTRMVVQSGDNVLIGGFIVYGSGQKNIALRALGPSLPVSGKLADPVVELHDATGAVVASNDNWRGTQQDALIAAGLAPANDLEAAVIASISPGAYTVVVKGVDSGTGVGLMEIYDLDPEGAPARLANISTRGNVLTADNIMIGGFIVRGDSGKRMLMRARGPSLFLNGAPIAGRLANPAMELRDSNGALLRANDNWRSEQQAEIAASSIAPTDDNEPAIVSTLTPGSYTTIVRGANNSTGIGLVEMYDLDQPPSVDGSTLYVTELRPQGSANSQGSGSATLRLAADGKSAILAFTYSNLTGPVSGMHIHAGDGSIIFDIDDAAPQPDGTLIWVFVPVGSFTVEDIVNQIRNGQAYINIHTGLYPAGEIKGFFHLSTGAQTAPVPTPPPALPPGPPTLAAAGRFLSQATFGATETLIAQVQNEGYDAFLNNQFSAPISSHLTFVDAALGALPSPSPSATPNQPTLTMTNDAWWTRAVSGPDQLRQRVAFALSELLVVSATGSELGNRPFALPAYYDVLVRNAFGNYRQLLEDITLNPAMGAYLNMLQNDKANASRTRLPNENYARELMQLFSIGLYTLNVDGSLTLSSTGFPIATYGQDAVLGTAAVLTGWTYAQPGVGTPLFRPPIQNWREPMINIPTRHETAAKTILNGVIVPANQTAAQDLKLTLDTIFNHPNVGPFVARHLIQRLVTSNPSPGYVYRVASVFNDNGQGVRGDLRAVVRTVLMDYDARVGFPLAQGAGHLREPVVRVTSLLRAFNATSPTGFYSVRNANANLAQEAMRSPTVFNFFSPDYSAPGAIAAAGLKSPEFEITTETTVITVTNFLRTAVNTGLGPSTNRISLNISAAQALASNPTALVDHLNSLLMAGSMSPNMRTVLINAVTQIPATNTLERTRTAIYLVINSPEFVVDK
ncbi:MAG TPA: DUF1800 family protein [Chthoniobacterales bacterium]|nr:DUF1800 family protein [Chthoniobacterales bacterium]